mgnify:CR=1 FL=1
MKCSIHTSYNGTCKHGDILIEKNKLCIIALNRHHVSVIYPQIESQSCDYINIPLCITKYINDPFAFYSMLLNHDLCPLDCKVMEVHLCPNIHRKFIGQYYKYNEQCRYTIIYPHIYEINKHNSYYIKEKSIV